MSINSDFYYQQVNQQHIRELHADAAQARLARELSGLDRELTGRVPWWRRLMGLNSIRSAAARRRRSPNHPAVRMQQGHVAR